MNKEIPDLDPSFFIGKNSPEIITFGAGQPDLPPPQQVNEVKSCPADSRYGLVQGDEELRTELSKQYPRSFPDSFVITNGASEALHLTLRALALRLDTKKKVMLPKPFYYSYPELAEISGLEVVYTDLKEGRIDYDDLEKKIKDCCAVIINSPSNPTGRVESISTLKKIEKLTTDLGIHVISDEVYKDLIYERENYLIEGPKVVTVNSFSKTYSMCGDRVGYLWSRDTDLVKEIVAMKTHTSMNTSLLSQKRAIEALKVPREYIEEQTKIWKQRRDLIYEGLKEIGLDLWKPEGAFYVLPKFPNPKKAVWELFTEHKVIVYDGSWFGAPGRIRLSYALDTDKIQKGLKIIGDYYKKVLR